jgi:hypothetical protein
MTSCMCNTGKVENQQSEKTECDATFIQSDGNSPIIVRGNFQVALEMSDGKCQLDNNIYTCLVLRAGGHVWGNYTVETMDISKGFTAPCNGDIKSY